MVMVIMVNVTTHMEKYIFPLDLQKWTFTAGGMSLLQILKVKGYKYSMYIS